MKAFDLVTENLARLRRNQCESWECEGKKESWQKRGGTGGHEILWISSRRGTKARGLPFFANSVFADLGRRGPRDLCVEKIGQESRA